MQRRAIALAQQMMDMARRGDTEKLMPLLDAGIPVEMADTSGNSLLMLAAYNGHPGTVRALIERGADVNRLNDRGQSPLAGVVFKGEDEVVQVLLEAGADPDAGTPTARATAQMFERPDLIPPA
ncbi:MAG: ankyrin repeat domain-containing protein [Propionibacteriales bacterium]|nr:ankyrin repeat domain-containing protein [Propionibacteriales bacterium]